MATVALEDLITANVVAAGLPMVQYVGPYRVNFDDAGVDTTGVLLLVPPASSTVILAFGILRTKFASDGATSIRAMIGLGLDGGVLGSQGFYVDSTSSEYPDVTAFGIGCVQQPWDVQDLPCFVGSIPATIRAKIWTDGGALTAGAVDVYLLIAIPVAFGG